jgi:hypothetical protein
VGSSSPCSWQASIMRRVPVPHFSKYVD